jgi:hypothetical protein
MLRVRTVFTGITGSPWLNTLNFGGPAQTGNQTDADAAVAAVGAFWGAVDALINSAVDWQTLPDVLFLGDDGVAAGAYATTPQLGTGAGAAEIMPIATQAVVRLLTGVFVGGRQLRGRIFIPGLTEASNASGELLPASATTITTAANTLNGVATPPLAVWSKVNATVEPVAAVSVWSQFGVLRSRRD